MAFNSNTYYANKAARHAWAYLKEARTLRDQIRAGVVGDIEARKLPTLVMLALGDMRRSVFFRSLNR